VLRVRARRAARDADAALPAGVRAGALRSGGVSFVGVRAAGNEYPIADDQFVLDFFAGMTGKPAAEIAHAVLTNVDFWGSDLTAELPGFEASVSASLNAIFTEGAAKAIEQVVAQA